MTFALPVQVVGSGAALPVNIIDRPGLYCITVAPSTASVEVSAVADYRCDGTEDDVQIQAAIDALVDTGGTVQLLAGTYTLAASVELKTGVSVRGICPGVLQGHVSQDLSMTLSGGTIITFPGGVAFTTDVTGDVNDPWEAGDHKAVEGVIFENMGFNDVASVIDTGDTNKSGLSLSTIRNIYVTTTTTASTTPAFALRNPQHIRMDMVKMYNVYQGLLVESDYDDTVANNQPGNSCFTDIYIYQSVAGHGQAGIHCRVLDSNPGHGTPLNYLDMTRIQVNRFATTGKTGCGLYLQGASSAATVQLGAYRGLDIEGQGDTFINLVYAYKNTIEIAGTTYYTDVNAGVRADAASAFNSFHSNSDYTTYDLASFPNFITGTVRKFLATYESPYNRRYGLGLVWDVDRARPLLLRERWGLSSAIDMQGLPNARKMSNSNTNALGATDAGTVLLDGTNTYALTLPAVTSADNVCFTFVKTGASGTVTLTPETAKTINGAATLAISTQWDTATLINSGDSWVQVANPRYAGSEYVSGHASGAGSGDLSNFNSGVSANISGYVTVYDSAGNALGITPYWAS